MPNLLQKVFKMLSDEEGKFLLRLVREAIVKFTRKEFINKPENYPEIMNEKRGVFCTLTKKGELRGCIGLPYPTMPLIDSVISAACSACEDPRFERLEESELKDIKIEISVLTEPVLIEASGEAYLNKIEPGKQGLILQYGPYSGLFLPQVWEELPDKEKFLDNLCLKAGLTPGMWKEKGVKLYSFEAQVFEE